MQVMPLLSVTRPLLFPYAVMPLHVWRPDRMAAIEARRDSPEEQFVVVCQRDVKGDGEAGEPQACYSVGTLAVVKWMTEVDEGWECLIQGVERVTLEAISQITPYCRGEVCRWPLPQDCDDKVEELYGQILPLFTQIPDLAPATVISHLAPTLSHVAEPMHHLYLLASLLNLSVEQEQVLLEAATCHAAAQLLLGYASDKLDSVDAHEMSPDNHQFTAHHNGVRRS